MPLPAWAPALTDVGQIVPTRTRDSAGTLLNTFTAGTTPTNSQVDALIVQIAGEVSATAGVGAALTIDSDLYDQAKFVAAVGVAQMVELTYPDTAESVNIARQLGDRYADALRRLAAANAGLHAGAAEGGAALPVYSFPVTEYADVSRIITSA